ncbi:MAG: DUF1294 domain-containing protein [Lachnospiraceae bacterium]|nr:DUF1294 domain-containing protein [Lachnospiraceae bacterium]MBR2529483.1 DUF1294 domain-containing protein [Lachnospiraceae bacterium]
MEILIPVLVYFAVINLAGFVSMAVDKSKARRNKWRIPEATLFLFAIFGGSLGCLLGMRIFRHKTQKPKFYIGIPAILGIQLLILIWFLFLAPLRFRIL